MVVKTIKYTNFNGETKEKECCFNLSKADLLLLSAKYGDISEYAQKLINENRREEFFKFFIDDILAKSYGTRSDDGEIFIKTPEKFIEFRYSPICDEMLISILTDESGADVVRFLQDVMPPDIRAKMLEESNSPVPVAALK